MPRDPSPRDPRAGDVLHVTSAASVQFGGDREIFFRLIRCRDWPTYDGWVWLDGYELNGNGDAVERRDIWVRFAGLRWLDLDAVRPARPRPANARSYASARRPVPSPVQRMRQFR